MCQAECVGAIDCCSIEPRLEVGLAGNTDTSSGAVGNLAPGQVGFGKALVRIASRAIMCCLIMSAVIFMFILIIAITITINSTPPARLPACLFVCFTSAIRRPHCNTAIVLSRAQLTSIQLNLELNSARELACLFASFNLRRPH